MIVECPSCSKKNRIPASRAADAARCGKCGDSISATGRPIPVDTEAFRDLVENSPLPVLVDFWAPWCGPCRQVAPEVAKLAERFSGEVVVAKLNTEENRSVAQQEGVRGIPMFALYKNGERTATQTGAMSADQLARSLQL